MCKKKKRKLMVILSVAVPTLCQVAFKTIHRDVYRRDHEGRL